MKSNAMKLAAAAMFCLLSSVPMFPQDLAHVVAGVVRHVDHGAKTVVVKTAEGTEKTFIYTDKTVWHGTRDMEKGTVAGSEDVEKGLRKGTHVVVHYTATGVEKASKDTAIEIRRADHAVYHAAKGTITAVDETAKTVTVRTGKGTEQVLHYTEHTLVDTGKGVEKCSSATAKEAGKAGKVTLHYTEEAGSKVIHVIRKAV